MRLRLQGRRTFAHLTGDDSSALETISQGITATWFDIDDRGSLDLFVISLDGGKLKITGPFSRCCAFAVRVRNGISTRVASA